jgi:acetyl esterase/lipase
MTTYRLTCVVALAIGCAAPGRQAGTGGVSAPAPKAPAPKSMVTFDEVVATPSPPADHRESYGPSPVQFGELRLPRGSARVPVVVFLHGGCWRAAYDHAHVAAAAASLADAGYAVWVPEYRRVGEEGGGWPGTFDDVASAVDHVRTLAARYPTLDTTRVILAGHSAGGQLALWAASRKAGDARSGSTPPLPVAGVVSLAGITDLATYASPGGCGSAVVPLMGGTPAEVPDRYRAVSPIERVSLGVPVRIVHGAADPTVPLAQSRTFAERVVAAGGRAVVTEVPSAGHFDVVAPQSAAWPAVLDAFRALAAPRER